MNRCVLHVIPPGFKKINYMMRLISIFSKRGLITQVFFLWWWCFLWRPLTSPYSASVIFHSYRKVIHFLRNYQKAHASPWSTSRKFIPLLIFFFDFRKKKGHLFQLFKSKFDFGCTAQYIQISDVPTKAEKVLGTRLLTNAIYAGA